MINRQKSIINQIRNFTARSRSHQLEIASIEEIVYVFLPWRNRVEFQTRIREIPRFDDSYNGGSVTRHRILTRMQCSFLRKRDREREKLIKNETSHERYQRWKSLQ